MDLCELRDERLALAIDGMQKSEIRNGDQDKQQTRMYFALAGIIVTDDDA